LVHPLHSELEPRDRTRGSTTVGPLFEIVLSEEPEKERDYVSFCLEYQLIKENGL
jgi:hypothetical protein